MQLGLPARPEYFGSTPAPASKTTVSSLPLSTHHVKAAAAAVPLSSQKEATSFRSLR